ncbi:hypothetical protein KP509_07G072100 [Ceratopteris richardii]|uniref:Uncharacterized protein n=1 Tax=Ceratopteris richardii TaxID=49495 RepID=A0A8T2UC21_CERRI|nr:hypothetical protein KP509_07G072100 [Ceratopteris richardii]
MTEWSLIAAQLPGRTDNDVKNYWNTRLKKKLCEMGIDPITHKPISQLLADLAGSMGTMAMPAYPHAYQHRISGGGTCSSAGTSQTIAEAALGCFKDDMLNVIMRQKPSATQAIALVSPIRPSPPSSSQVGSQQLASSTSSSLSTTPSSWSSTPFSTRSAAAVDQRTPPVQHVLKASPLLHMGCKFVGHIPIWQRGVSPGVGMIGKDNSITAGEAKDGGGSGSLSKTANMLPPYLRFLNPTPITSALPFHQFFRSSAGNEDALCPAAAATTGTHHSPSGLHNQHAAQSMKINMDMLADTHAFMSSTLQSSFSASSSSTSTLISGGLQPKSSLNIGEASSSEQGPTSASCFDNLNCNLSPSASVMSCDTGRKLLMSEPNLQEHSIEHNPWFHDSNNDQQYKSREDEADDICPIFNWDGNNCMDNNPPSPYMDTAKREADLISWSTTSASRSNSPSSNTLNGTLDADIHHHISSSYDISGQSPVTSIDAMLWDLSDLNAFMS